MNPGKTRHRYRYWLAAVATVVVLLLLVTTLHLGTQISPTAQRALYRQTVEVVTAERDYAIAHAGQYTELIGDLATADPRLSFLVEGSSPVVQFDNDNGNHGYFIELADQSTGGAASFSVLISDDDTAVLECSGPGPLCSDGRFRIRHSDYALQTWSQRRLYEQTVALIKAQRRYSAVNGGHYAAYAADLATFTRSLAYLAYPNNPVAQLSTDVSGHGYYAMLANDGGSVSFSVLVPDHGAPVLTCVGTAPLCSHGTFNVPRNTFAAGG